MALKGIEIHGWADRLAKANAAYKKMVEQRRREKAKRTYEKLAFEPFMNSSRDPSN